MPTTRREILDDFLAYVAASNDDLSRNRAERALNRALNAIWLRHPWTAFIVPTPFMFTTTSGVRSYALPDWFGRIAREDGIIRNVTNRSNITPIDPLALAEIDPLQGTTNEASGTPGRYYLAGLVGVHTQPDSDGEELEAVSSSDDDTTVRVFIEGLNGDVGAPSCRSCCRPRPRSICRCSRSIPCRTRPTRSPCRRFGGRGGCCTTRRRSPPTGTTPCSRKWCCTGA